MALRVRAAKSKRGFGRAALEPGEARFDVKRQSGIVKDLVDARLVTPIDPPPHQKLEPARPLSTVLPARRHLASWLEAPRMIGWNAANWREAFCLPSTTAPQ